MQIKPFAALRPQPLLAAELASVPYDVVDTEEARKLAAGNPNSFLHVARPEIDLPKGIDLYSDAVYAQGVKNFQSLQDRGVLFRESEPSLYLYQQVMGAHVQTGVVCCCSIDDYANRVILRHEKTRKDKEDDRTRHTSELNANTGPVFLTYRATAELNRLMEQAMKQAPLYQFTATDGICHTVWRVTGGNEPFVRAFAEVPVAYVADGHHRAASAFRVGSERRLANPNHTGDEEYNWFLAVLFPADQLQILPYNRCVADLNGFTPEEFLRKTGEIFSLEKTDRAVPKGSREVCLYLQGSWYRIFWPEFKSDPVSALDVSVLQNRLLAPLLGIDDPRTNSRISFIGGIRGTQELEQRVDSGRDAVAFSMYPVTVEQMMAIADANAIMPPKSTWFEPKLRSGLLIHTY